METWEIIPGRLCHRQEAFIREATARRLCQQGPALALLGEMPASAQAHPITGEHRAAWGSLGQAGTRLEPCARRAECSLGERRAFLFTAIGPTPEERYLSPRPLSPPACRPDFPGPFFLSVSTVTWAGRKFARVSDNCVKGSRKQAEGKRVSTGRLHPTRPSGLRYHGARKDSGAWGRGGPRQVPR